MNRLGNEFLNQPIDIARELLSEKPRVIYEGMQNIGYRYENEAKQKNISFNPGNGIDIIVGKKNSKNLFNINAGSKFLVAAKKMILQIYHYYLIITLKKLTKFILMVMEGIIV
ncbi:hypothetical protein [Providencia hangzhouensis]|uniref:hypothetical protein n=1 Tax=Providencia hangzhouensis TaxID=3031799 RepID=UPI0034DD69BC